MSKRKITILGTGNAMVKNCYNTCFMVENGGEFLLVCQVRPERTNL